VRSFRAVGLAVALPCAALVAGCPGDRTSAPASSDPLAAYAADETVREPAVAGAFYPGDADELRSFVADALAAAEPADLPGRPIALIAPHAGYVYSGAIAAAAYAQLHDVAIDTVMLVGPAHRAPVTGVALPASTRWRTPLGEVPIDAELCAALQGTSDLFTPAAYAHRNEHSLEVQLPFLQVALDDFAIVPLLMHDLSDAECEQVAQAIADAIAGRSALLVASTDMSHYPAQADARRVDRAMLDVIAQFDPAAVRAADAELMGEGVADLACTMCGLGPVLTVMRAAQELGADSAVVIDYANSGDVPGGDATQCVGYGAVVFCAPEPSPASEVEGASPAEEAGELDAQQQARLLALARETITAITAGTAPPDPPTDDAALTRMRACFVTLHEQGELRGCIGTLEATQPLGEAVVSAAASAATRDPRFLPVQASEAADLHIEISVLSPMREVTDPEEIVCGTHGVLVEQHGRSGVFLPQVATEQGWDRETMLTELCAHKAGLPADAWRTGARLYVFTAQVFAEDEGGADEGEGQ